MRVNYGNPWTWIVSLLIVANVGLIVRIVARSNAPTSDLPGLLVAKAAEQGTRIDLPTDRAIAVIIVDEEGARLDGALRQLDAARARTKVAAIVVSSKKAIVELARSPSSSLNNGLLVDAADGLQRLGLPKFWNQWYVFDSQRRLIRKGDLSSGGLTAALTTAVEQGSQLSADAIVKELSGGVGLEVQDGTTGLMTRRGVAEIAVLLVRRVFTGCPAASVVRALEQASARHPQGLYVVAVPDDWSDTRIDAMRSTFRLTVPIFRVDSATARKWKQLSSDYGALETDVLFVMESTRGILLAEALPTAIKSTLSR